MLTRTLAIGTAVLGLLCSANWGHASLVVIQPGAEGKDTWVSSAKWWNDRHGNGVNLTVGLTPTRYILIQFDSRPSTIRLDHQLRIFVALQGVRDESFKR